MINVMWWVCDEKKYCGWRLSYQDDQFRETLAWGDVGRVAL